MVYLAWSMRYGKFAAAEPLAGHRARVADPVAAAHPELRGDAGGRRGGLRLPRPWSREAAPCLRPRRRATRGPLVHHFADLEQQKEASALGMWIFLVTEILFFGGLLRHLRDLPLPLLRRLLRGAATTCRGGSASSTPWCSSAAASPWPWPSTRRRWGRAKAIVGCLVLTILLGGVFLGVKYFEYREKIAPCLGDGPHAGCLLPGPSASTRPRSTSRGRAGRRGADLLLALLRDDRPARPPHDHRDPHPGHHRRDGGARAASPPPGTPRWS